MHRPAVMIMSSDRDLLGAAISQLERGGYSAASAETAQEGMKQLGAVAPTAAVLDLSDLNGGGVEFIRQLHNMDAEVAVIGLVDGGASPNEAEEAGAYDCLAKPVDWDRLIWTIRRASEHATLQREIRALRSALDPGPNPSNGSYYLLPTLPEGGVNLQNLERELLSRALEKFRWNQTRTARYLHISRRTLIYRMGKYKLKSTQRTSTSPL